MAAITTTITFADGDQVTSTKLNQIATGSTYSSGGLDNTTLKVTAGKLSVGTITSSEMGTASVVAAAIASGAVTEAKIGTGAVTTTKLGDLAVTAAKIAAGTITFAKLSTAAVADQAGMEAETGSLLVTADVMKNSPGVAKAYGCFTTPTGTTRALETGSHNVASVAGVSSEVTTVTFTDEMATAYYTVVAGYQNSAGDTAAAAPGVYTKSTTGFTIKHEAASSTRAITFCVFGALA